MSNLLLEDSQQFLLPDLPNTPLFVTDFIDPLDGIEASVSNLALALVSGDTEPNQVFGSIPFDQSSNYPDPTLASEPLFNGYDWSNVVEADTSLLQCAPLPPITSTSSALPNSLQFPEPVSEINKRAARRRPGSSSSSSTGSSHNASRTQKKTKIHGFSAQKPTFDPDHPWVRTNAITEGKSTRTGKCNDYRPTEFYKVVDHPIGTWDGPKHRFKYDKHGGLYKAEYTTKTLQEFLYHHPGTDERKLVLWIQRTPADSARRYPTAEFARCRFADCPAREYGYHGNIQVGHYRVALDEKWNMHKEATDPYFAAGYVHLYCLERFMDFSDLCNRLDVRLDSRHITHEPNHHFAAALDGAERAVAERFLEACRFGFVNEFRQYAIRADSSSGDAVIHKYSLTYAMNAAHNKARPAFQKRELKSRELRGSQIIVHKGDLQMCCEARAAGRKPKGKRIRAEDIDDDNSDVEEILQPPNKKHKTQPIPEWPQTPRRSPRAHRRVDYSEGLTTDSALGKRQRTDDAVASDVHPQLLVGPTELMAPTTSRPAGKTRPPPISTAGDHLYRPNKRVRVESPVSETENPSNVLANLPDAIASQPLEHLEFRLPEDFDWAGVELPEGIFDDLDSPPKSLPAAAGTSPSPTQPETLRRSPRLQARDNSVSPLALSSPALRRSPRNHSPADSMKYLFEDDETLDAAVAAATRCE